MNLFINLKISEISYIMCNYDIDTKLTLDGLRVLIENLLNDERFADDKIHKINIDTEFMLKLLVILKISLSKYEYLLSNNYSSYKNKHQTFLDKAASYAKNSNLNHKHGCIIVYDKEIISTGYNKKNNSLTNYSIHAEVDAINNLNKKYKNKRIMNNASLYVVRIRNGINDDCLKMSKPCLNCAKKIMKLGIKNVYYSVDNDYVNDFLYEQIIKFNKFHY